MPEGPSNIEDLTKRFKDINVSGLGDRIKKGFTKPRIAILVLLALVVVFFAVIAPFARLYTDALWYNHVGFQNLFWKMIWAKILMVVVFGAAFFVLLFGNILLARRIPPDQHVDLEGSPLESIVSRLRDTWSKLVRIGLVLFAVIASLISGLGWAGKWETVLKFLNHTAYGQTDPVFHKDIGYYLFSYPFQRDLVDWLLSSLFFIFVVVVVVYIFSGGIRLKRGPDMLAPHVKAHLSVLLAVIFLVKAWSYRLNMYELLWHKRGTVWGAGYTDVHAQIPALWIMLVLALVAALILLYNIRAKGWILPAIAVGALVVVTLLAGTLYPWLVQTYVVKPSELAKETKYLAYNIEGTRQAYKIDKVDDRAFSAEANLDQAGIERNRATIRNIRLWDPRPMLNTVQQLQAIRQYYNFQDVDVDRYTIDGVYRQTMIAAREMAQGNLPAVARTWVNNTLIYTHGYGACLNPSNDVTDEGNPVFLIKDIPPTGPTNLQISEPSLYFAENSTDPVIVDSTEKEFDYPRGDENVYTFYKGDGGVKVHSFWRKLLFAIRFSDVNMLFSGQVRNQSQVMYYRDIKTRIEKCAPFLKFDRDPYLVINDAGKLFWIIDGYATSDRFPYSQPATEGFGNYVRNSVKAVVDAREGKVWLYVVDPKDPVISTYRKIFPQIFTPFEEMPVDLRRHLRYPEDYFSVQAGMLTAYHMTNPRQFYNKEDLWAFPNETLDTSKEPMVPYYVIMRLPGERGEEMVMMLPFTPNSKQNMISWLGARMDGDHYGELINYLFPSDKLIYGPEQIEGRIEQDPDISRQLSLWRQAGSQVIRGNLLVIPIEESILYVEPLYLQATQIPIPQIKRVVVVYGQQVVMETTLEGAIARIFGGAPPSPEIASQVAPATQPSQTVAQLSAQAVDLYNKAIEAQKAGDWATYGQLLAQLSDVLNQLKNAAAAP